MESKKDITNKVETKEVTWQEVEVFVDTCGDYCAMHEMSIEVVYDITNDIQLGDDTLEELYNRESEVDFCCAETTTAYKINGNYFLKI